jgi:hypothetical protein
MTDELCNAEKAPAGYNKVYPASIEEDRNVPNESSESVLKLIQNSLHLLEPVEFYAIRSKAVPKAPSTIRYVISLLFCLLTVAVFVIAVLDSLNTKTLESDIFRSVTPELISKWDQCVPITTLGSTFSPFKFTFVDDCYKRIDVDVYNTWYLNFDVCHQHLLAVKDKLCSTTKKDQQGAWNHTSGWMRPRMSNMLLFQGPFARGYDSYFCDGY